MSKRRNAQYRAAGLAGIVLASLALAACGGAELGGSSGGSQADDSQALASAPYDDPSRPDITDLCGDKEVSIALADGFGGNAWRQIVRAQFEKEAAKCPNIVETIYTNADGDPQKYASDINGLVAQGVDAIITFDDFGQSALPTLRKAFQAGVVVVPYVGEPGGVTGEDYTAFIAENTDKVGEDWANWAGQLLDSQGEVTMLGGSAGNPLSTAFQDGFVQAKAAGLSLSQDDFIATDWTVGGAQEAAAAVITQFPDSGALITDYGAGIESFARAYETAGKELPPVAATASTNQVACAWDALKAKNPNFELLSVEGTTNVSVVALRKALAEVQGIKNDEPTVVEMFVFIDTLNGKMPQCMPDLPADADLSADLTAEEMGEVFAN